MDVRDAVATRFSCRAFLDTPVPESVIRDILVRAARAPSGGNLQPWRVIAMAGNRLEALRGRISPRVSELPQGEGAEYDVYPKELTEPYRTRRFTVGEQLYRSIDVPREDRAGRYRQFARNFEFFGAPVALFVIIDRQMGPPQWSDVGMFIQTAWLLARDHGLHGCAQEAWTRWHKTLQVFLELAPNELMFCGMALGYADETAPINSWRSAREPLDSFATFLGFDDAR
jgi:nitroreductase